MLLYKKLLLMTFGMTLVVFSYTFLGNENGVCNILFLTSHRMLVRGILLVLSDT